MARKLTDQQVMEFYNNLTAQQRIELRAKRRAKLAAEAAAEKKAKANRIQITLTDNA